MQLWLWLSAGAAVIMALQIMSCSKRVFAILISSVTNLKVEKQKEILWILCWRWKGETIHCTSVLTPLALAEYIQLLSRNFSQMKSRIDVPNVTTNPNVVICNFMRYVNSKKIILCTRKELNTISIIVHWPFPSFHDFYSSFIFWRSHYS